MLLLINCSTILTNETTFVNIKILIPGVEHVIMIFFLYSHGF